jgi:alkanesulfonate monooxygenase SsuD/methylene tetrahydromethanopterin reductase-like flavin-dependent oxidoreductase (luciferase family)
MQFGLFQSAQWPEGTAQRERLFDAVEQSVLVETLGFESVFMTEHHFSRHGIVPDNLAMLAYLAARTSRVRLGTAVTVLPLHDPIRVAESAALVDLLSNGRLEFGIGRGYQWGEFDGFGLSLDDRIARFEEACDVILRAWSTAQPFSHSGRFWQYRNVFPQPQPLQHPHPPIWMATTSDDGFELCVERGWGVMLPQAVTLDVVGQWVAAYKDAFLRARKAFDPAKLILARGLYIGEDDASAWEEAGPAYREFLELAQKVARPPGNELAPLSFDLERIADSAMICGADSCIEKLDAVRALGIEYVMFFSNMGGLSHRRVMKSLQRFGGKVMPAFRL